MSGIRGFGVIELQIYVRWLRMAFQGLLGGPAVETPQMQRMWVRSLVGELRSHVLHSRTKKKEWLSQEFPGGPVVVRTGSFHCPGPGFHPWSGNSDATNLMACPPPKKYFSQEGKIWTNTLTKAWRNKQRQVLMVMQTVCQFGNKYQSLNTINLHCFIIIKINFF